MYFNVGPAYFVYIVPFGGSILCFSYMIQTVLMGQYVLLHPKSNSKLQALLNGTPFRRVFYCTSWDDLASSLNCFKHVNAVYVRFSHISNFQPKSFIWVLLRRLFCVVNIHDTGSFCKSNKTNLFWLKLP